MKKNNLNMNQDNIRPKINSLNFLMRDLELRKVNRGNKKNNILKNLDSCKEKTDNTQIK